MTTPAPIRLRCNEQRDPLGIIDHPLFSWWAHDERPAELQSAYEIEVATSESALMQGDADLWHSGRIEGSDNSRIPYQGLPLFSSQQAWWRVRTFDSDGMVSGWSQPATFEMGLLDLDEWGGAWIAAPLHGDRFTGVPAVALRRDFELSFSPRRARVYLAVCGSAKLCVNGHWVGAEQAAWVPFSAHIQASVFDVSHLLTPGKNTLGVLLAAGLYAGHIADLGRELFGTTPALQCRLLAEADAGQAFDLFSDDTWKWRPSQVNASDPGIGDTVDCRLTDLEWFTARTSTQGAGSAISVPAPAGQPYPINPLQVPERSCFPRENPRRQTVDSGDGETRLITQYEFSEHIIGRVRLILTGKAADAVEIRYSSDGVNFDSADRFTTLGNFASEVLVAPFSKHSFSTIEVEYSVRTTLIEGVEALQLSNFSGVDLHSDHATLNKLVQALNHGLTAVAQEVPMRGMLPQQRLPDLGYAYCWVPTFARQLDASTRLQKYLDDAATSFVTAAENLNYGGARLPLPGSTDEFARFLSITELVWSAYRYLAARDLLVEYFPRLRAMALSYRHRFSDLLCSEPREALFGTGQMAEMLATLAIAASIRRVATMARIVDHHVDAERLSELAEQVIAAARARYLTGDGHVVDDSLSALLGALAWGLLSEEEAKLARLQLVERVRAANYSVQVVPAVLPHLLPQLAAAGRLDLAYMILLQTSGTSWMGQMHAGERLVQQAGRPEAAVCSVLLWLLECVMGISLPDELDTEQLGYKHVRIAPRPPLGAQFAAGSPIQNMRIDLPTVYGVLHVDWNIQDERFELNVVLPPSCTADVELPDGFNQRVQSGRHSFVMAFSRGDDGVPTLLEPAQTAALRSGR